MADKISDKLSSKTQAECADIKSAEIAKLELSGKVTDKKDPSIEIEIIGAVNKIEVNGQVGIEVFAKAWKGGKQLGFGDGTVEIERFRIFNPPILVDADDGDIIKEITFQDGSVHYRKLKEDPAEAIRQTIAHNCNLVGKESLKIEKDKVGNTTDTYYPSYDAAVNRLNTDTTWSACRDATSGLAVADTTASEYFTCENRATGKYEIARGFFVFDTSAIRDTDTIDSGTISLSYAGDSSFYQTAGFVDFSSPDSGFTTAEYDVVSSYTEVVTQITPSAGSGSYDNWTLNAAGLSRVSKTGKSHYAFVWARDISNTTPTASTRNYWSCYMSEQTGTANDPKLVIVHFSATTTDIKNSSLATGLQAYWDLEEASGVRYDLVGSNNLTDTNTVTQTTGKIGNCAFFTCANSEELDVADNASLDTDDGWSVSYWLKIDSTQVGGAGDYQYVYSKRSGENGTEDFIQNDSGTWYLYVGTGTGTFAATKVNVALSLNTWYHVVTYYNGASSKCYINGSSNSISLNAITTNTGSLYIGGKSGAGTANFAGAMEEFGIWNRELTQSDVTALYNSGNGLPYYDPTDVKGDSTLSTSLVSYWKLDETSGTRADSHGSNTLADPSSTGYSTGKLSNAASFSAASSDYLAITDGSQSGLGITGNFSMSCWFNLASTPSSGNQYWLMGKKKDGDTGGYWLSVENDGGTSKFQFGFQNDGGAYNSIRRATYSYSTSTWYHVVVTCVVASETYGLYVNGVPQTTTTVASGITSASLTTADFRIGSYGTSGQYFDGLIDEPAVWTKALTVAEVRALYGYGTPPEYEYTAPASSTNSNFFAFM
jgi:Concanavalin A-like lectin/glucanases superfamily